ncbi:MAG: DNA mismatch repair endonuclease MutL [Bacteroidia bacterium]
MPDVIKLLPDHVANQIAAGEVIQRPASVVKELLDNAVDAKSTKIQLIVEDAGKTLIQVIDNGVGMSDTDARLCWERHATSKINAVEDLFKLNTMGFRGEALASIASVAQVEMKTKRPTDEIGTYILIEASNVLKQENTSTAVGTSIAVKNLFYNIPARRNFLKSNIVEFKHIVEEFTRCALANPQIHLTLINENEVYIDLAEANLKQRILQLFKDKKQDDLLAVNEQTLHVTINGFIGLPQQAKKMRGEQYLFVNNRFIKDAYLNHAINAAFEGLITKEQFPFYIIKISIEPSMIDVNIHPTKTEIKFEDDKNIYQIMRAVVKKALGGFMQISDDAIFDDNRFMKQQLDGITQTEFQKTIETVGNAGKSSNNFKDVYSQSRQKQSNWDILFKGIEQTKKQGLPETLNLTETEIEVKKYFQLNNAYIVTQIKSGLMLIDQQRAHERILFERYLHALDKSPVASQQLLFPKAVVLHPADEQILLEILPQINTMGFNINAFGKQTYVINGLPAELNSKGNEKNLLEELIETYKQTQKAESDKNKNLAKVLARQAAIKRGTKLNADEMQKLIDELFACIEPKIAPDGKPCVKTILNTDIEAMF